METSYVINCLEKNIAIFSELLKPVSQEEMLWRILPEKWNLLEIVCHLCDEEKEDFKQRIKQVFETPEKPFPSIDPAGWVSERNYGAKDYLLTLNDFIEERRKSVEWLKSLTDPPFANAYVHPKFGHLSAIFLLTNWLAHDYLHIRQIIKIKYDYLAFISNEKLDYAGNW